jgi:two-component system response regulator AtoC
MTFKILIVDDEAVQRDMLSGFLQNCGYQTTSAAHGNQALELAQRDFFHLVLLDHKMPGMTGDELLEKLLEIHPGQKAIMITAFGAVSTAVQVMKLGAVDFLEKPVDLELLHKKIAELQEQLQVVDDARELTEELQLRSCPITMVGQSTAMRNLLSLTHRLAPSAWSVLINGETGTGKELLARMIHHLSPRNDQPFIEVNCAAVPENLFESELFGHEKGSFTGATSTRQGKFEAAEGGTLFLDEVGELPLLLQSKLLRALQEKRICRVGSSQERKVDVRVLAATNRNLLEMVDAGSFREDLYYRLNVFEMEIPPLRQRKTDIPELIAFFLEKYNTRPLVFSDEAIAMLMKYPFPGNVRELEHLIQRLVTLSRSRVVGPGDLPENYHRASTADKSDLAEQLDAREKEMLRTALEKNNWVQTRAAQSLGISERVLRYKMAKFGIEKVAR